jgi:hypothetical protein
LFCPLKQLLEAYAIVQSFRGKTKAARLDWLPFVLSFSQKYTTNQIRNTGSALETTHCAVDAEGHLHAP